MTRSAANGLPHTPALPVAGVEGLSVQFRRDGKDLFALRGIDLAIAPGEIVALVGESGSGKTVLSMSLLGLLPENARVSGAVEVDGVDMIKADESQRREVRRRVLGAVFQDPMTSLDPTMRIGRQLQEVAGSRPEAIRLLEAVGIPEAESRLTSYPHQLSGGLRQRVMLAIALAGGPRLVIADEPTTALDVTVQAKVLELLRKVRDEFGCAILFVTHDLAVASAIADRVCVLYGGRVFELGDIRSVLTRPAHPYTASLMQSRIGLRASKTLQLPVISGEPIDPTSQPPGCSFAPRCPAADGRCVAERPVLQRVPWHEGLAACHYLAGPDVARRLLAVASQWPAGDVAEHGGVSVEGVTVRFEGHAGFRQKKPLYALNQVDLKVGAGEAVALVGESGSGKTTLLRVIAGLQDTTSGEVVRNGRSLPQMIFQDAASSFTPWLTIGQHLEERVLSLPTSERRQRVMEALVRLGLPVNVADARPRRLSGGQRQRAAIARAIIEPPDLLLCDEPTSSLDASLAATVLNLLGELRRDLGFALVFVTHDLAAARLIADRIVVMSEGRIVEQGDAEQLITRPVETYTRTLLASVPEVATGSGRQ